MGIEDLFMFAVPARQAKTLFLRLPASALGEVSELRLRIPTRLTGKGK
jgi:hypothetical protein